tara:strand:- start:134783 stop:135799 length:1017 start_codon:yes stop_codon:yes gene_type:complete
MQTQANPMTEILEGPEAIVAAIARLGLGQPIAFPTETVYGLGADAFDHDAVERIFTLKGRPASNPLIVHVSGCEMVDDLVEEWTSDAQKLADAFWPGSLTLVLNKSEMVPDIVTAGGPTVAIRCPAHPMALGLIEAYGKPIVGPSANPSGWISPTTADHVARGFEGKDVLILDGGACRAGIESTVVDLTGNQPLVLRPGVISTDQISRVLGVDVHIQHTPDEQITRSPGMTGPHYQPSKPTRLKDTSEITQAGPGMYLIAWSDGSADQHELSSTLPSDAAGYARGLYNAMHEADASNASEIWIERPPKTDDENGTVPNEAPIWHAVMERLNRACHPTQ